MILQNISILFFFCFILNKLTIFYSFFTYTVAVSELYSGTGADVDETTKFGSKIKELNWLSKNIFIFLLYNSKIQGFFFFLLHAIYLLNNIMQVQNSGILFFTFCPMYFIKYYVLNSIILKSFVLVAIFFE